MNYILTSQDRENKINATLKMIKDLESKDYLIERLNG